MISLQVLPSLCARTASLLPTYSRISGFPHQKESVGLLCCFFLGSRIHRSHQMITGAHILFLSPEGGTDSELPHIIQECHLGEGVPGRLVVDSGLDAFSQYPSHDSFATPATRLIAETRGAARGFLSYYHVLPSSHPRGR